MVIRWLKTVIGVVGSGCEGWVGPVDILDKAIDKSREEVGQGEKFEKKKEDGVKAFMARYHIKVK